MAYYYVNKNAQSTGEHEVHKSGCLFMPAESNRQYLGNYDNCKPAITEAKRYYSNVDGCKCCCKACHEK